MIFLRIESAAVKCASGKNRQRHRREAPAAAHVEDPGPGVEGTDFGNGQRVQHVSEVELVEILARDDIDLGIPPGIEVIERRELPPLRLGDIRKIFENQFHVCPDLLFFFLYAFRRRSVRTVPEQGFSVRRPAR